MANKIMFKNYLIEKILFQGKFTILYQATSPHLKLPVHIKALQPEYKGDSATVRLLEKEALIWNKTKYPYIVRLTEFIKDDENVGIVLERYPMTLSQILANDIAPPETVSQFINQMSNTLHHLHENAIIHGALHPHEIYVDGNGNTYLDGIFWNQDWCLDGKLYRTSQTTWKHYAAPEVLSGAAIFVQSDIYSLAVMALQYLTGEAAIEAVKEHSRTASKIYNTLEIALNPVAKNRFQNMPAFDHAFRAVLPDKTQIPLQPIAEPLTKRELEILNLMAQNLSNEEIADKLGIAKSTVSQYVRGPIFSKLSVHSRQQAIHRGMELELTDFIQDGKVTLLQSLNTEDSPIPFVNPYQGLKPFDESDANVFFGREDYVDKFITLLEGNTRFIALMGASGSGKSSLIDAALLPAIRQNMSFKKWFIVKIVPDFNPLDELVIGLNHTFNYPIVDLLSILKSGETGLVEASEQLLRFNSTSELLLIIDQFEELFTLVTDETQRVQFIQLITSAVSQMNTRIRIIIALRADFYDRPLQYVELANLLRSNTEILTPLFPQQLEHAIIKPAQYVGLTVETGLTSLIVQDVYNQPGALPLLQYTLSELFEAQQDKQLTVEHYKKLGGVIGTLSRRADELYKELNVDGKQAAQQIFFRLLSLDDAGAFTLRRVARRELYSASSPKSAIDEVLNLFGRNRLLTFDSDKVQEAALVQISHEALINHWERLNQWCIQWRDYLNLHSQLSNDRAEWIAENKNPSFLVSGTKLLRYETLLEELPVSLSEDNRVYLQTSLNKAKQQEAQIKQQAEEKATLQHQNLIAQRILIVILAISLTVALGLISLAHHNQKLAIEQAKNAISHQLATQSMAELQNPIGNDEYAALLAIRALDYGYVSVADETLVRVVERLPTGLLFQHETGIQSLAYSPDGQYVAAGDVVGQVFIINTKTTLVEQQWQAHEGTVWDVQFSPDGQYVLSAGEDAKAIMWNITGQLIHTFNHNSRVRSVIMSANGEYIFTGSIDETAKIWSAITGELIRIFDNSDGGTDIFAMDLSPDELYLATGEYSSQTTLWDVNTGEKLQTFAGHINSIYSVSFSPDGQLLAIGSSDNTASIWNIETEQMLYKLEVHSSSIRHISFSPDGQFLLTASADGTCRLWDVATGTEIRSMRSHRGRVLTAIFSPDGREILTGSEDGTIKRWRGTSITSNYILDADELEIYGVAVSPDDTYIVTVGTDRVARLWDTETQAIIRTLNGHEDLVTSAEFSPDGNYLATGSLDRTARVWAVETGEVQTIIDTSDKEIWSVAFTPDGNRILTSNLTSNYENSVRLWNANTGEMLQHYGDFESYVIKAVLSPDGHYIAAGGEGWILWIWNTATGELLHTLNGHQNQITSLGFSTDSRYIISGSRDGTAIIWDIETGEPIRTFEGHTNTVTGSIFSADGQYVITASADRTARIWNANSGELTRILSGHTSALWDVEIFSDNTHIVTASLDGTARLWDVDYHDFVISVCNLLTRDFTDLEREQAHLTDLNPTCPQ